MKFSKYQTNGQDIIIIDQAQLKTKNASDLSRKLCKRSYSIGADSLIIYKHDKQGISMQVFNPDGSEAEISGNALICLALLLKQNNCRSINTKAGAIQVCHNNGEVTIDMGEPKFSPEDIPMIAEEKIINSPLNLGSKTVNITALSMGNPHCIVFVETYDFNQEELGTLIENHSAFPNRTNVDFVQIINKNELSMQIWERGAGVTLSCGSGASAAVVASVLNRKTEREVLVRLLGGNIKVNWSEKDNHVYITGKAEYVYSGELKQKI